MELSKNFRMPPFVLLTLLLLITSSCASTSGFWKKRVSMGAATQMLVNDQIETIEVEGNDFIFQTKEGRWYRTKKPDFEGFFQDFQKGKAEK
jgi:hypothetical protein